MNANAIVFVGTLVVLGFALAGLFVSTMLRS